MSRWPPPGDRIQPILTGALLALSFPPAALLLPPFVALVPLLVHLDRLPDGPAGRWRAIQAGMLAGAVYFGLVLYWMIVALAPYSLLAVPAYVLTVVLLSSLAAGFAWAVHYARRRVALPLALTAAIFWTAMEWTQGHLGDLAFPWLGLGTALAAYPVLAGAADLMGARGLSFVLAAVNGLLATAVLRYTSANRRPGPVPPAVAAALIVAGLGAYGAWRSHTIAVVPVAEVAVVQPNIPDEVKRGDRAAAIDSSLRVLIELTRRVTPGSVDLVAWPEVAIPGDLNGEPPLQRAVAGLSGAVDAPVLAGAYGIDHGGAGGDRRIFNSAFLVAGSRTRGRYDKQRMVPFVERTPFAPWLVDPPRQGADFYGGLQPGRSSTLLRAGNGAPFGVLICYESIFADLGREYRRLGARFLVNITNDAWYGREPWYARTTALWQHPSHLVLRAIETRMGVARAANTGFSMFIDPRGRVYGRTTLFEPTVRTATVYTSDTFTLFTRWGDWLATTATAAALALLFAARVTTGVTAAVTARVTAAATGRSPRPTFFLRRFPLPLSARIEQDQEEIS